MSRTIQDALRVVAADLVDGWTLESITCSRAADEIERLRAEVADATKWNHSVRVCKDHTTDIVDGECVICELAEKDKRIEELEANYNRLHGEGIALTAEVERLRESIFWACGVNGTFALRQDGEGAYWWRPELRARAGISGEELNRRALDGEE